MPDYNYDGIDDFTGVYKGIGHGNFSHNSSRSNKSDRPAPKPTHRYNASELSRSEEFTKELTRIAAEHGFTSKTPNECINHHDGYSYVWIKYDTTRSYTTGIIFRSTKTYKVKMEPILVTFKTSPVGPYGVSVEMKDANHKLKSKEIDNYYSFKKAVMDFVTYKPKYNQDSDLGM